MSGSEGLVCLLVAPSATMSSQRQSEALFDFALKAPLREGEVEVRWARKLSAPAETSETPVEEVRRADFVLAEVSANDPVVFLYLGLAVALEKTVVTLRRPNTMNPAVPKRVSDLHLEYEMTSFGLGDLNLQIREILGDLGRARKSRAKSRWGKAPEWSALAPEALVELVHMILLLEGASSVEPVPTASVLQLIAEQPGGKTAEEVLLLASVDPGLSAAAWAEKWWQEVSRELPSLRQRLGTTGRSPQLRLIFVSSEQNGMEPMLEYLRRRLKVQLPPKWQLQMESWGRERLQASLAEHPQLEEVLRGSPRRERKAARSTAQIFRETLASLQPPEEPEEAPEQEEEVPPSVWRDLAFTATHSIGNKLFPIEAYLVHLQKEAAKAGLEDSMEAARRALVCVEKAKVQIERFKSLSTDSEPNFVDMELTEPLQGPVEHARNRGVHVELFSSRMPRIWADPQLVDEVLDELVTNALTWLDGVTMPKIVVTLRVAGAHDLPTGLEPRASGFLWLRFEDNGPGVDREDKDRIFELFYSRNPQGKGIGLSSIRKAVRSMAGEIVESGAPGQGGCFDIFLPLAEGDRS